MQALITRLGALGRRARENKRARALLTTMRSMLAMMIGMTRSVPGTIPVIGVMALIRRTIALIRMNGAFTSVGVVCAAPHPEVGNKGRNGQDSPQPVHAIPYRPSQPQHPNHNTLQQSNPGERPDTSNRGGVSRPYAPRELRSLDSQPAPSPVCSDRRLPRSRFPSILAAAVQSSRRDSGYLRLVWK